MIHQFATAALLATGNFTNAKGGAYTSSTLRAGAFVPPSSAMMRSQAKTMPKSPSERSSSSSTLPAHRDDPIAHHEDHSNDARSHTSNSPLFRSNQKQQKHQIHPPSALHAHYDDAFFRRSQDEDGNTNINSKNKNKQESQASKAVAAITTPAAPPVPMLKGPKEAYDAFADKGMQNAKKSDRQVLHQSILGGAYVGFAGLLCLIVAGNLPGIAESNPGLVKMAFAALFPCNLLFITTTGGQLFTGNSATVAAARYENKVTNREMLNSWGVSLLGNIIGCGAMALAASYTGLLSGGAATLTASMATSKVFGSTVAQILVKATLCNWMVSLALFLSGAASDLTGKLVGIWFPISTFVAIGLEHSIANLFLLPSALLLKVPGLTLGNIIFKNLLPAIIGNAIGGALVVAASYSYQFGSLGKDHRTAFGARLKRYEARKEREQQYVRFIQSAEKSYQMPSAHH